MYAPPLRSHYESILSSILGEERKSKSSLLLQAYVTFSAMISNDVTPLESYSSLCKEYVDYRRALLRITDQQCKSLRYEEIAKFVDLPLQDFLTYVTPDIVCDPVALMMHYHDYNSKHKLDQIQLIHHIIAIKLNSYQKIPLNQRLESIRDLKDDALTLIYRQYKENENNPLPISAFKDFYSAINVHLLDPDELSPKLFGSSGKLLSELLDILFNDLQLTRVQSLKMVRDFFCDNHQAVKITMEQDIYPFIQNKDNSSRIKLTNKALKLMAKFSPLELACAISLRKKDGTANERNKTEAYILPNDITVENGLVYSSFFSAIAPESDSHILVLLPTPHFINKVLWSSKYKDYKITFVLEDSSVCDAILYQASDPSYAPVIGSNIHFTTYQQWSEPSDTCEMGYTHVLLFGTRLSISSRSDLAGLLQERCTENTSLLILEPSQNIEFRDNVIQNDKITIEKIALIPQGINNSTRPRRKVLIRCKIHSTDNTEAQLKPIEIHTYTLNTVLKTQALSVMHEDPVLIDWPDFCKNPQSLRQLYSKEIMLRRPAGRERNPSFSHEITPDIVVWCSKTYPKDNQRRPRLEAYVCEPAPATRINSGFTERGNRIKSTIKHTTSIPDKNILDWLENVYPYSVIAPKRTKTNIDSTLTVTSIRDEIITHYTEYLSGQNIALKTLWYLYPSLEDHYSKSSYQILSTMMSTLIGEQRVCDLTAELCEYLLCTEYPDLSQENLWTRFEILSTALDQAVSLGYCPSNNLRLALRQAHVRDKLFAQVRNALTKKHFTRSELQKVYTFVLDRIKMGQALYLGVLIRLLTGLESKIVCALRWCDLLYSPEYDLYSAVIARRINEDGSFEGFRDNEDYLLFPISEHLRSIILHIKQSSRIHNDNQLILGSLLPPESSRNYVKPSLLNQLTQESIASLDLDERVILLPHHGENQHETDLNKYHGDIIRQNFRFWATEAAKLNADELSYLLRNKPSTTLGCYYCDFLNEASQLMLHVKLNRIDAILHKSPSEAKKHTFHASRNFNFKTGTEEGVKKRILLEISSKDETSIEISVNSQYGVTLE